MNLTSQQIFSISQSSDPMEMLEKMKERRKDVMDIEKGVVVWPGRGTNSDCNLDAESDVY